MTFRLRVSRGSPSLLGPADETPKGTWLYARPLFVTSPLDSGLRTNTKLRRQLTIAPAPSSPERLNSLPIGLRLWARVIPQETDPPWPERYRRLLLVGLPTYQSPNVNTQQLSRLTLDKPLLKSLAPKMLPDGNWIICPWHRSGRYQPRVQLCRMGNAKTLGLRIAQMYRRLAMTLTAISSGNKRPTCQLTERRVIEHKIFKGPALQPLRCSL